MMKTTTIRIDVLSIFMLFAAAASMAPPGVHADLGAWTDMPQTSHPVAFPISAWTEGVVAFAGGVTDDGATMLGELQAYDTNAEAWMEGLPLLPIPVFGAAGGFWDTKVVLAAGYADTMFVPTDAVQLFDVLSGQWTSGTASPTMRGGAAGAILNGTLYMIGGSTDSGAPDDNPTYQYDISGDSWTVLDPCPLFVIDGGDDKGGWFSTAVALNGKIYVGGHMRLSSSFFCLDPSQPTGSQWSQLADIPAEAGKQAPSAIGLEDENIIVWFGGGVDLAEATDQTFIYDVATDSWENAERQMTTPLQAGGYGVSGGFIYSFGGLADLMTIDPAPFMRMAAVLESVYIQPRNAVRSGPPGGEVDFNFTVTNYAEEAEEYLVSITDAEWSVEAPPTTGVLQPGQSGDLCIHVSIPPAAVPYQDLDECTLGVTGVTHPEWTDSVTMTTYCGLGAWEEVQPLPEGRAHAAACYADGYVWLFGGTSDPEGNEPTNTVYRYNPVADDWEELPDPMPWRLSHSDAVHYLGKIYLLGGKTDEGNVTRDAFVYDIESESWTTIPGAELEPSINHRCAAANGMIYRIGGQNPETLTPHATVWTLNPNQEEWTSAPPMATARFGFVCAAVRNVIYACGGSSYAESEFDLSESEMFDQGAWTSVEPMLSTWSHTNGASWGHYLVTAGGQRAGNPDDIGDSALYESISDHWMASPQTPMLNQGRLDLSIAAGESYVYAIGGRSADFSQMHTEVERLELILEYPTPTVAPTMPPPSPTPPPTWTWAPATETPTAAPTNTPVPPTATPAATATPETPFGVTLEIPTESVSPGETFFCVAHISNPGGAIDDAPFVALLDIGINEYWFYPSWAHYPPGFDHQPVDLPAATVTDEWVLAEFTWPDTGSDSFEPIFIHAAILTSDFTAIVGEIGSVSFGYGP